MVRGSALQHPLAILHVTPTLAEGPGQPPLGLSHHTSRPVPAGRGTSLGRRCRSEPLEGTAATQRSDSHTPAVLVAAAAANAAGATFVAVAGDDGQLHRVKASPTICPVVPACITMLCIGHPSRP